MGEVVQLAVEGADGSHWIIHGPGCEAGGVVLDEDPENLWETPTSTIWTSGAYQEGGTFGGERHNMQDPILPVHISATRDSDWLSVYSRWRRAFRFDRKTYLVGTSRSGVRRLAVQLLETPPFKPTINPGVNGYAPMVMRLRAGWPFWVEEPVVDVFQSKPGELAGTVMVSNPTNHPCYLQWVVVNAAAGGRVTLPDFSWQDDPEHEDYEWRDRVITTPTLSAGEQLTIDSYPDEETWRSNINPMFYGRTAGVEFEFAIPAHTEPIDVPVSATAAGTVIQVRQPRNWRTLLGGD